MEVFAFLAGVDETGFKTYTVYDYNDGGLISYSTGFTSRV